MARTNVPQDGVVCQEISEKSCAKLFQSYRDGFDITKLLAVEVFDGGNDRAADILMLCGFDKLIGGTNYASIGDVAGFYGISQQYLKEAMRRYGVGARNMPEDVFVGQYYDFMMRFGDETRKRYTLKSCNEPGTFALYDSFTKRTMAVKGDYRCKMIYISARLILMLPCFLLCGRSIPADSVVNAVFDKLQRTRFSEAAKKRKWENEQQHLLFLEEKRLARIGQSGEVQTGLPYDPGNILSVRYNGDVIMNGEVFGKLLDRSETGAQKVLNVLPSVVRDALVDVLMHLLQANELSKHLDKKPAPGTKRRYPTKLKKPDKWDETTELWSQHRITTKEAARRAGMSVSSFRNYTVNGKTFA